MPPVRYYNQTAPFWDFVANLEEQGSSPWSGNHNQRDESHNENNDNEQPGLMGPQGFEWGPWGPFPFRGGRRHHHHHPAPPPPPPPPHHEGPPGPAPHHEGPSNPSPDGESDHEHGPSDCEGPRGGPRSRHHRHHHGHGGPGSGPGGRGHGGRGRGGFGGRGRRGLFSNGMGPFGLAEAFQNHLFGDLNNGESAEDFKPEVDVFDTPESFVVHVSLAGAKKEDVGVSWNAEKSELSIAGVIHRPGDEEFLKTLAMDERKVGAFERSVRLGSRANPAQVDVDAISARMEDGILRIDVPKLDAGYVEIKKVDIE